MDSLYPYYVRAMGGDVDAFAREFPYLFLVQRPLSEEAEAEAAAPEESSDDGERSAGLELTAGHSAPPASSGDTEYSIAAIRKRPGFPPYNRVVVGRIASSDVVISHPSVSKHHAQFHLGENRTTSLSDRRSSLGTFVNGRRLEPYEIARVAAGDHVRFGRVDLDIVDAARLYEILRAL